MFKILFKIIKKIIIGMILLFVYNTFLSSLNLMIPINIITIINIFNHSLLFLFILFIFLTAKYEIVIIIKTVINIQIGLLFIASTK